MGWQDAPLATPASSAQPAWMSAPLASNPAEQGVPNLSAAIAARDAYQPPSTGEKIRGGIEAALQTATGVLDSMGGMFGEAAGKFGATLGAISTTLTGGVHPDDPRVLDIAGRRGTVYDPAR